MYCAYAVDNDGQCTVDTETIEEQRAPSNVYSAEHLLRLFGIPLSHAVPSANPCFLTNVILATVKLPNCWHIRG